MNFPTPEEIERAAKNWSDTYRRKVFACGYQDSFFAGANWHRQQVEPLLERVRDALVSAQKFLLDEYGTSMDRVDEALALLSEEGRNEMNIDDKEIEKELDSDIDLAALFCDNMNYAAAKHCYKAGFRKCEAMMREKWPSEDECRKKALEICLNEPERVTQQRANENVTRAFYDWLKDKIFGKGAG